MLKSQITEELLKRIRDLPSVDDVLLGLSIAESSMSRIEVVWLLQEEFLKVFFPKDELGNKVAITQDILASMTSEIEEIRRLLPWKHWKVYPSDEVSFPEMLEEIVDLFHFFVNLCIMQGIDFKTLYEGYLKKRETNRLRLRNQYLEEGI